MFRGIPTLCIHSFKSSSKAISKSKSQFIRSTTDREPFQKYLRLRLKESFNLLKRKHSPHRWTSKVIFISGDFVPPHGAAFVGASLMAISTFYIYKRNFDQVLRRNQRNIDQLRQPTQRRPSPPSLPSTSTQAASTDSPQPIRRTT